MFKNENRAKLLVKLIEQYIRQENIRVSKALCEASKRELGDENDMRKMLAKKLVLSLSFSAYSRLLTNDNKF